MKTMRHLSIFLIALAFANAAHARQSSSSTFPPFEKWRAAVLAGDSSALSSLYTQSPAPDITGPGKQTVSVQEEVAFWSSWKSKGLTNLTAQVVQDEQPSPDIHTLVLQLTLTFKQGN